MFILSRSLISVYRKWDTFGILVTLQDSWPGLFKKSMLQERSSRKTFEEEKIVCKGLCQGSQLPEWGTDQTKNIGESHLRWVCRVRQSMINTFILRQWRSIESFWEWGESSKTIWWHDWICSSNMFSLCIWRRN